MKRVTFVLIGLVAIIVFLTTSKSEVKKDVAQVEKVTFEAQTLKSIYD